VPDDKERTVEFQLLKQEITTLHKTSSDLKQAQVDLDEKVDGIRLSLAKQNGAIPRIESNVQMLITTVTQQFDRSNKKDEDQDKRIAKNEKDIALIQEAEKVESKTLKDYKGYLKWAIGLVVSLAALVLGALKWLF